MTAQLTFTPIRDGYSVIPTYPIIEAMYDGGTVEKRLDALFATHEVNVNWKLNALQYTNFMGFFRTTLRESTEFFLMDLVTDIGFPGGIPHRCRTKGGMPKLTQVNGSCFYVSAVLEVEVNPTYTGLILYEEPNLVIFNTFSPRFVGPLQPGDTVMVFNSSGTHPDGTVQWTFDGVDDQIDIGNFLSKERTDAFSISGDFASGPLNETTGGRFISKADTNDSVQRGWLVSSRGNITGLKVNFALHNTQVTNNIRVETTGIHSSGKFLVTYDGSSSASGVTIYINGTAVATTTVYDNLNATTVSNASLTLGNREDGARPFQGTAENLAVWNRELTSLEAAELAAADEPGDVSFADDLEGWWKVDVSDATGAGGVVDHSAGNHDGTAQGGIPTSLAGPTDLNLDGTYEIVAVDPNNEIQLDSPELVNEDWSTLATLGSPGQYGDEDHGAVISTITRLPR